MKAAGLGHEQVESRGATNKVSALHQQKALSRQKPNQVKSPSLVQDWQSQGRAMTQRKLLFLHTQKLPTGQGTHNLPRDYQLRGLFLLLLLPRAQRVVYQEEKEQ